MTDEEKARIKDAAGSLERAAADLAYAVKHSFWDTAKTTLGAAKRWVEDMQKLVDEAADKPRPTSETKPPDAPKT